MRGSDGPNAKSGRVRISRTSCLGKTLERILLFAPGACGGHLSLYDLQAFVIRRGFHMLDGVGTLILFFLMNCDDFRNQSNIRILVKKNVCADSEAEMMVTAIGESDSEEIVTGT